MKFNISYPATGNQKVIEVDDERKLRNFYDKRISHEVFGEVLGDEFKGYLFRISGGNDKQGFPMKQGVLTTQRVRLLLKDGMSCYRIRRKGERKRKSVRGCIVSAEIAVLNLVIVKKGEGEIPGLTDSARPRRLGPKRASRVRKLFNLSKEDDVRQFVIRRTITRDGKKDTTMRAGWKGLLLLGLGVFAEAFVSGPLRLQPGVSVAAARAQHVSGATTTRRGAATTTMQEGASSAGVEVGEISGKRLFVEFAAFGFFKRNCQLELRANGDSVISKGMVTPENGAWRIEAEEGTEFLQFSCPLTELYSEIFEIPSSLLFWRVPLRKGEDGSIVLEGGQIISERKELFGLKTTFIDEGTFKARVLADDEEFPAEDVVDISKIPVPEGLTKRKRRIKAKPSLEEEVAEPPLPSDLQS